MEVLRIVAPWYFYGANEGRLIACDKLYVSRFDSHLLFLTLET